MKFIEKIKQETVSPIKNLSKTQNDWFISQKNKVTLDSIYPKYTERQKEFARYRPEREYRRFPETKKANSGMDVDGKIKEFIKKDIIKPMSRPSLYDNFDIKNPHYKHIDIIKTKPNKNEKWALNTTCRAPNFESLPKVQPFKFYYFPPKYNNKDPEKYREYALKSDHIGIKVPKIKKIDPKNSFLKLKRDYSVSSETKKEYFWKAYTGKNSQKTLSSKNYDIINFMPIVPNSSNCQIMNRTLYFRKKGLGEFLDLSKTFRVNCNKDFLQKFKENPKRFAKCNGIFSYMYNASQKNGSLTMPFAQKKKTIIGNNK